MIPRSLTRSWASNAETSTEKQHFPEADSDGAFPYPDNLQWDAIPLDFELESETFRDLLVLNVVAIQNLLDTSN